MTSSGSRKFIGRHLMVKGRYVEDILSGRKKATIRRGIVKPKYDEIIVHGGGRPIAKIRVTRVYYKRVYELSDEDALKDGFNSREELIKELKQVYPGIRDDEYVTIIEFEVIQRLDKLVSEDPYMGLTPADIARIALRYLSDELGENDRRILLDLTRTNSIRSTAIRLFGTLNKRYIVRKVLRKALDKLIERGIIRAKRSMR
jgi:hypothetical protein